MSCLENNKEIEENNFKDLKKIHMYGYSFAEVFYADYFFSCRYGLLAI